jgi:hypothetical protein
VDEYLVKNVTSNYLRFTVHDTVPERSVVLPPGELMRVFLPNVLGEQARIMAQARMLRVTRDGHLGRIVDWPVQSHVPLAGGGVVGGGTLVADAATLSGSGDVTTDPGYLDYPVRTFGIHEDTTVSPFAISAESASPRVPWITEDI